MAAEPKLRWGILGCARISRRGLIPGIRESQLGTLQAIASRDSETATAWAAEFGIPRSYGRYQELLDDPKVDAVYIPLPNEMHRAWVFAAADAGKHVLCEKPLSLDVAEAKAMVAHCRERNVLLMEAFMWRHQPRTAAVRRMVAGGSIGELRLIRSSFSFPIEPNDWRLDRTRGGGALWDVGCYGLSTARLFAGAEPKSIRSVARFGPTGVDMSLSCVMTFPNGIIGEFDCSFEQPFRCSYELVGTKGVIEVPDAYLPPANPLARMRTAELTGEIRSEGTNQYSEMVDAFAEGVKKAKLVDPAEDGLAQMTALESVIVAARSS
ncbi:Gfo/Idh/MocA family protein [Singulisphaera rosea]